MKFLLAETLPDLFCLNRESRHFNPANTFTWFRYFPVILDSGFHMDFVPKDDIRKTLLRYLSKVTFSDEDDFGLRLPDEKLPDGFKLLLMRCSKRAVYSFSEEFSIVLSKGNTGVYGRDIQKV